MSPLAPPPPAAPPPVPIAPDIWDLRMNFMMVAPALLTTSCLLPLAAPPDWSKSLEASARAMEICVEEVVGGQVRQEEEEKEEEER